MIGASMWALLSVVAAADLSVDEAVRLALSNSPLLVAEQRVAERDAAEAQAIDIRNPELQFGHRRAQRWWNGETVDNNGLPYGPFDDTSLALSWKPPALKDIGFAQASASRAVLARQADLEDVRRDVAAEVRSLHARVRLARAEQVLLGRAMELSDGTRTLVRDRVAAAASTALDAALADLDDLDARLDAAEADGALRADEARLRALIGQTTLPPLAPFSCRAPSESDDALLARARDNSPRRHALDARIDAARIDGVAAWLGFVPWVSGLQAELINRATDRPDDYRLRLDVEIPVFRVFEPDRAVASLEEARAVALLREEELQRQGQVLVAAERLRAAAVLLSRFDEAQHIIAEGEAAAQAALQAGATDALSVLSVQGRSLKARRQHLAAQLRCEEAWIELSRLTGDVIPAGSPEGP